MQVIKNFFFRSKQVVTCKNKQKQSTFAASKFLRPKHRLYVLLCKYDAGYSHVKLQFWVNPLIIVIYLYSYFSDNRGDRYVRVTDFSMHSKCGGTLPSGVRVRIVSYSRIECVAGDYIVARTRRQQLGPLCVTALPLYSSLRSTYSYVL